MGERMVQVPVSLIERAPHAPGCQVAGLWILPENGGRAVQQSGKCTCWKAEVDALFSQPTPSDEETFRFSTSTGEELQPYATAAGDIRAKIAAQVMPGWTPESVDAAYGAFMSEDAPRIEDMAPGTRFVFHHPEDGWRIAMADGKRIMIPGTDGAMYDRRYIDPSTIRDVTPPSDTKDNV